MHNKTAQDNSCLKDLAIVREMSEEQQLFLNDVQNRAYSRGQADAYKNKKSAWRKEKLAEGSYVFGVVPAILVLQLISFFAGFAVIPYCLITAEPIISTLPGSVVIFTFLNSVSGILGILAMYSLSYPLVSLKNRMIHPS